MGIEASIILQFGEDVDVDGAKVTIEFDDEHENNKNSDGELVSSFLPVDEPVFLIQYNKQKVYIKNVECTDGRVTKIGYDQERQREQEILFTKYISKEGEGIEVGYLYTNSLSSTFRGNTTSLILTGSNVIFTTAIATFPCVADCTFQTMFQEQWKLIPPSLILAENETYSIYVVVYVENKII